MAEWKALSKLFEKLAEQEGFEPVLGLAVPNWDPAKHPHGKHGHWAKKHEAVYHALNWLADANVTTKQATYTDAGNVHAGATPLAEGHAHVEGVGSSASHSVKVGGVEINPPEGETGDSKTIDYALAPGEAAYKVQTGTSDSVVITHADNTATQLLPTKADEAPKIGKTYGPGQFQGKVLKNPAVTTEKIDHAPGGQSYTQSIKTAKAGTPVINSAALAQLPAGTTVRKRNAKYTHVWEDWTKQPDGNWERTDAFKASTPKGTKKSADDLGVMVDGGKSTFVVQKAAAPSPAAKKAAEAAVPVHPPTPTAPHPVKKAAPTPPPPEPEEEMPEWEMELLGKLPETPPPPKGVPAANDLTISVSAHIENHSGTSDKFYMSSVIKRSDGTAYHMTRYGSTKPGSHITTNVKEYPNVQAALDAHDKLVNAKLNKGYYYGPQGFQHPGWSSQDYKGALIEHLGGQPPSPLPKLEVGSSPNGDQLDALPAGTLLTHVSGNKAFVKAQNGGWLSTKDNSAQDVQVYNWAMLGKLKVTTMGTGVGPGWADQFNNPPTPEPPTPEKHDTKITVPGTNIELQPGQSLYSGANQHKYALVEGGKVVAVLDKDTGADIGLTKQGLWHWDQKLKKGQLSEVHDNGGGEVTGAPALKTTAKAAPQIQVGDELDAETAAKLPSGAQIQYFASGGEALTIWTHKVGGVWTNEYGDSASTTELNWSFGGGKWKLHSLPSGYKPAKKAVKKAPAKKVAAAVSGNDSFTVPGTGKVVNPAVGEHILTVPNPEANQPVAYYKLDTTGHVSAYDSDGHSLSMMYAPTGKKSVKSLQNNGYILQASGPPKQEVELPTGKATKKFSSQEDFTDYAIRSGYYGANKHSSAVVQALVVQYRDPGEDYASALKKPEFAQGVADVIASLTEGRDKYKAKLTPSQKTQVTKTLKTLTSMQRMSILAQKMDDPDYTWDANDDAEWKDLQVKSPAKGFNAYGSMINWMNSRIADQKFLAGVKGLGFDPNTASHEQVSQYVHDKGAVNVAGMTPNEAKQWMLLDLGSPQVSGSKEVLEKQAGSRIKVAAVAANAKEVAAKKAALAPSKEQQAADKAKGAKLAATYKVVAGMSNSYDGPDGESLEYDVQTNSWEHADNYGEFHTIDATAAAELILSGGGWKPSAGSHKIGNPAQVKADFLDADGGLDNWRAAENSTLAQMGASYAYSMSPVQRRSWLNAYLRGDKIAQYAIEADAAVSGTGSTLGLEGHPGNPDTPEGQLARQTMANWLTTQQWYHPNESLGNWSDDDINAAVKALGLDEAADAMHAPLVTQNERYNAVLDWQLSVAADLPDPQTSVLPAQTGEMALKMPDGTNAKIYDGYTQSTLMLQPGDLVVKSPDGAMAVFRDNNWLNKPANQKTFLPTEYVKSGPYPDKQSAYGFLSSTGGYKDATPKWAPETTAPGLKVAKPVEVDQTAWDAVLGAEAGGPALKSLIGPDIASMEDDNIEETIGNIAGQGWSEQDKLRLTTAPDSIKRLTVWCAKNRYDAANKVQAGNIAAAIQAKLRGGEYIDPEVQTWTPPGGGKPIPIPPGATLYPYAGSWSMPGSYVLVTGKSSAFTFDSDGALQSTLTYQVESLPKTNPLAESKANLTPEKAAAQGFEFSQESWDALTEAEQGGWTGSGPEAAAAHQFKQALKNVPNTEYDEQFAALQPEIHALPSGVKSLLVKAAQDKNTDLMTAIMWKVGKGAYSAQVTQPQGPLFNPNAPYAQSIASGWTDANSIQSHWPQGQMLAFGNDHGMDLSAMYLGEKASAIATKIAEIQAAAEPVTSTPAKKLEPAQDIQLSYLEPLHGSSHHGRKWTDQYGDIWLSKDYPNDASRNDARVDAEEYAGAIARLFGFSTPASFTREIDGRSNFVQKWAEEGKYTNGMGPNDFNDSQLIGIMQSQVFSWLVSDHDRHDGNFKVTDDGRVILIDNGQAFKHHDDDKLKVGYKPGENPDPEWFDQFFKQVQQKKIDRARAEKVAVDVMYKAHQMQSTNDAKFEEYVRAALARRPKSMYGAGQPWKNEDELVAAIMDRKHNLVSDFEKLYKDSWKKAGWDWKVNTSNFGKKIGEAHVQNGPDLVKEVSESKPGGVTLMGDTRDIVDAAITFTPMQAKDGSTTMLGFAKVAHDADQALTAWCNDRFDGPKIHSGSQSVPDVIVPPNQILDGIDSFHNALIDYSKTVGYHAPNGGGHPDGEYAQGKVQSAQSQAEGLKNKLAKVLKAREDDPTKPLTKGIPSFLTLEQQDAWVAAAQLKLHEYDLVVQAQAAGKPPHVMFPEIGFNPGPPPSGGFKEVTYNPTKDLGEPGGIAEQYLDKSGALYVRTSDGGQYFVSADGKKKWINKDDFKAAISKSGTKKLNLESAKPDAKVATETWTSESGEKFVRDPEDLSTWHAFNTDGSAAGDYTHEEMNGLLDTHPDKWTYDNGKENGGEKSIEAKTESGKEFTLKYQPAATHSGVMQTKGPNKGKIVETKAGPSTEFQHGSDFVISYGDVTIRYRPWTEGGVIKSQQGLLQMEIKKWDPANGQGQIDDVLDTLHQMGIDFGPATETSLQLQYWRHVTTQSQLDKTNPPKIKAVKGELAKRITPGMSEADELQAYKDAWATAIGKTKVDNAPWQPRFQPLFGQAGSGRPEWMRPDITLEELYKLQGNGTWTSEHSTAAIGGAVGIVRSGTLMPSEERVRILGNLTFGGAVGASVGSMKHDQTNDATWHSFTRNFSANPWASGVSGEFGFVLDPRDMLNVSNYVGSGDVYGARSGNHGSFDPSQMFGQKGSHNEFMMHGTPRVVICTCQTESARKHLIDACKLEGVTTGPNGEPLEEFILGPTAYKQKMKEIWQQVMTEYATQKKVAA